MSCCMPTTITTKNMEKSIIVLDVRDSLPYYLTTIFWAMTENIGVDGSKIVCLNGFSSDIYISFSEKIFGFIISCSHKSVLDIKIEKPFKKYLTKLIRYYHGKKPILGIGYGHQLLALALGGKIKTNKSKEELGSKKI